MTTIGLIGSGNIGSTVARLAVAAGHDVVLSNSRGPETLAGLVATLGPKARAATAAEAAAAGDLVVVSVPFKAFRGLPVAELAGKVVLDTDNYYPQRDGTFAEIDEGKRTSAELEQDQLAGAHVVKVFNNIYFKHLESLARPSGGTGRTALPIAGDDAAAKAKVAVLIDDAGFDVVDAGGLDESWRQQPDSPVYLADLDSEGVRKALAAASAERPESFSATASSPGTYANPA